MPTPQPLSESRRRPGRAAAFSATVFLFAGIWPIASATADCLAPDAEAARVAEVRDARTIVLADGRLVRPAGIESFALIGGDAEAADALLAGRLADRLAGRQVVLDFLSNREDRYGRRAALIGAGGDLVQAQLAAEGVALAFPDDDAGGCMPDILAAEEAARRALSGRWSDTTMPPADPGALSPHLGAYVIFEGTVLSVGNRTRRTYLNFGRRWSEDVTVVIEAADRDAFGGPEGLEALAGRRVRVRGFVEERGGPMVTARWTGQIEIVAPVEGGGNGS